MTRKIQPWERPIVHVEKGLGTMTKAEYDAQVKVLNRPVNWSPYHKGYPSTREVMDVASDSNYRIADPHSQETK
jgi:hypothetical protein